VAFQSGVSDSTVTYALCSTQTQSYHNLVILQHSLTGIVNLSSFVARSRKGSEACDLNFGMFSGRVHSVNCSNYSPKK
jgi:hypothetical protein